MIKHVWFDMGGTLYRETPEFDVVHDELRYRTYADIVGEPDLNKAKQQYDELYKIHNSNSKVFSSLGKPSDFWQQAFDELDLARVLKPDPILPQTLEQISQLVPISIFTNFKPAKIRQVLDLLTIDYGLFANILSGDDVSERKPSPEGFYKMVELSKLPADQILYIGDRVDVDIKPARAVGMRTCLVWQSSPDADYSAANFLELRQVLRDILA
jgi:HAD superfamily hydrolase (TIGR01549 family)